MKKQKIRFYAALLCSSMVFSLVSTPVSAAETGQLTNPPTSTEELSSPESISGNEAASALNGLSVLAANGEAEVTTASELTGALADSSISRITLKGDIDIGSTLTVNRTVFERLCTEDDRQRQRNQGGGGRRSDDSGQEHNHTTQI